jgi:predicted metalloendopeptidase
MRKTLIGVLPLAIWCGSLLATGPTAAGPAASTATAPASGVDFQYIDNSVRLQDDFFRHVSGKWLDTVEIPADRARYGSFDALRELSEARLHDIIDELAKGGMSGDVDAKKIADMYGSFMDEARLETLGLKPLQGELARIDALADKKDLPALAAHLTILGVNEPFRPIVNQDARESTRYAVYFIQSGLGLPDRDYYLKDDDTKLKNIRAEYVKHVQRMLTMGGVADADRAAAAILQLETGIAKVQWTRVENRDPVKSYNKTEVAKLPELLAHFDWKVYFAATEIGDKVDYVIVRQPSFLKGLDQLLADTPLPVWKAYFKWHLLDAYAPYLDKHIVDEDFAFSSVTLRDIPENRPRWKRGVTLAEESIGEGLGRLYVAKYFPPEYKARMQVMVQNLLAAYRQSIETLDWMEPQTKKEALAKLASFSPKIAYPDRWRDYSALEVSKDDLVGNVVHARRFEYNRQLAKLGKPVDRGEWGMTPQTINAYYNPLKNEIVFPAAILQPPFFNPAADDAVNYGGIAAVIGHEVSHGFDDQGSQFDGDGNLRNWWTKIDREKFSKLTKALSAQYSSYSPLPGYHLNGDLTLGENIGDNSGLAIAYKAYHLSLAGRPAPVIDGFTGDQRFYLGWAQVWRGKARDAETIRLIKVDPHSPSQFRCNGTLVNQPGFYSAFNVKETDKMYLPPAQRVSIW